MQSSTDPILDVGQTPNNLKPQQPESDATAVAIERLAESVHAMAKAQQSTRRWNIVFRLLLFVVVLVPVILMVIAGSLFSNVGNLLPSSDILFSSTDTSTSHTSRVHTGVVRLTGFILPNSDNSAESINTSLTNAFSNNNVKGVILLINSPGGSAVQADLINAHIQRLKAKYKKPIYSVVEDMCASGAYFVAVATDKIFVNRSSIVGSIGVRLDSFGFTEAMNKLGIERRLITAGKDKAMLDPFLEESPEHRQYLQETVASIHQHFIDTVKAGRGERLDKNTDLFTGRFWTGDQSIKLGLVDDMSDLDTVAQTVIGAQEMVDYTYEVPFFERLGKQLGISLANVLREQITLRVD